MKLIIDTSILIDNLRGGTAFDNILDAIERDNAELLLPTVVLFELYSGRSTQNKSITDKISKLLKHFQRIQLTESIAIRAGVLFRDMSKQLGAADYIIAASALETGGEVVTLNRKHFEQIPQLHLYQF